MLVVWKNKRLIMLSKYTNAKPSDIHPNTAYGLSAAVHLPDVTQHLHARVLSSSS